MGQREAIEAARAAERRTGAAQIVIGRFDDELDRTRYQCGPADRAGQYQEQGWSVLFAVERGVTRLWS